MEDKYGRHECLDRTFLLTNLLEQWLYWHDCLEEDELKLVDDAGKALNELYQLIGSRRETV